MYERMLLYVLIAVLTCVATETSQSVLPFWWAVGIKASLQGFIALRAYIDQTPANSLSAMRE